MTPTATLFVGFLFGVVSMFCVVYAVADGLLNRKDAISIAIGVGLSALIGVIGAVWGNW